MVGQGILLPVDIFTRFLHKLVGHLYIEVNPLIYRVNNLAVLGQVQQTSLLIGHSKTQYLIGFHVLSSIVSGFTDLQQRLVKLCKPAPRWTENMMASIREDNINNANNSSDHPGKEGSSVRHRPGKNSAGPGGNPPPAMSASLASDCENANYVANTTEPGSTIPDHDMTTTRF